MSFVSIVMPVFNAEDYLSESIGSILRQSYTHFELIIVDDGSTDSSHEVCDAWALKDPRITILSQRRKGEASARNLGILASAGSLIAVHDADDISEPTRVGRQVAYLRSNPDVAAVGSYMLTFGQVKEKRTVKKPLTPLALLLQVPWSNPILHPTAMVRRSVIEAVGLYNNVQSPDLELWTRVLADFKVANIPEILVHYRRHDLQTSRNNYLEQHNQVVFQARRTFLRRFESPATVELFTKEVHELIAVRGTYFECSKIVLRVKVKSLLFLLRHSLKVLSKSRSSKELGEIVPIFFRKFLGIALA